MIWQPFSVLWESMEHNGGQNFIFYIWDYFLSSLINLKCWLRLPNYSLGPSPTHDNFSIFATSVAHVFALSIITALKTSLWSKLQSILTMPGMWGYHYGLLCALLPLKQCNKNRAVVRKNHHYESCCGGCMAGLYMGCPVLKLCAGDPFMLTLGMYCSPFILVPVLLKGEN